MHTGDLQGVGIWPQQQRRRQAMAAAWVGPTTQRQAHRIFQAACHSGGTRQDQCRTAASRQGIISWDGASQPRGTMRRRQHDHQLRRSAACSRNMYCATCSQEHQPGVRRTVIQHVFSQNYQTQISLLTVVNFHDVQLPQNPAVQVHSARLSCTELTTTQRSLSANLRTTACDRRDCGLSTGRWRKRVVGPTRSCSTVSLLASQRREHG